MIRNIAGLIRHTPIASMRALRRLPHSEFRAFLDGYRQATIGQKGATQISLSGEQYPYVIRHGTSDFAVFCQVLLAEEYRHIPQLDEVENILDAGANVGYSTRYLLRRFPGSRAVAVEPDAGNVAAARQNLLEVQDRCSIVHGAVWPSSGRVGVVAGAFRDGREWSVVVTDSPEANVPTVEAVSIAELVSRFALSRIDVLKIDIEGAEVQLFSGNTDFMANVRCCAIELHDATAIELFRDVCSREHFSCTVHGETTIAVCNGTH